MTYDDWKTRTPEDESSDPPVTEQIDDVVCSCCGGDRIMVEIVPRGEYWDEIEHPCPVCAVDCDDLDDADDRPLPTEDRTGLQDPRE